MDMNEFNRRMSEELEYPDNRHVLSQFRILRFTENSGKSSVKAVMDGAVPVYPDKRYPDAFHAGETWFCDVNILGKTGFARPLRKVDESLLIEMEPEAARAVAEVLATEHPELIPAVLERAGLCPVSEPGRSAAGNATVCGASPSPMKTHAPCGSALVKWVDRTTLESDAFRDGMYKVFISPDLKKLKFHLDGRGDVKCENHRIKVLCPGLERRDMPAYVRGDTITCTCKP